MRTNRRLRSRQKRVTPEAERRFRGIREKKWCYPLGNLEAKMSPREKTLGPMDAVLPGEVEATRQALLSLRGRPEYSVNEVMRRCIPILGFRKSDGHYLLPETEIARLMGVDPKTANRFMRRGQGYMRDVDPRVASAALVVACRDIEFMKRLPEVQVQGDFDYFSDAAEIKRFLHEADLFEPYRASIQIQPWLPLSGYFGAESGLASFAKAQLDAHSALRWGGLFRKAVFDHNCSLTFQDTVDTVTEKFDGTCEPFYASFGVELHGYSAPFEFRFVSDRGATLFRRSVYVTRSDNRFCSVLFQVADVKVKDSNAITALLSKDGIVYWRKTVQVKSAFDVLYDSMFPEVKRRVAHSQLYAIFQMLSRSLSQVGLRLALNFLLKAGVISKSYLRNKLRLLRRVFNSGHYHQKLSSGDEVFDRHLEARGDLLQGG